jgi:hypothetical protein
MRLVCAKLTTQDEAVGYGTGISHRVPAKGHWAAGAVPLTCVPGAGKFRAAADRLKNRVADSNVSALRDFPAAQVMSELALILICTHRSSRLPERHCIGFLA